MSEQTTNTSNSRKPFRRIISYEWVVKNIGFFLFLALLAVLYIANGHMADKSLRDADKTEKELKELQYEYKTLKSEIMFRSRESEIIKVADPLGLKMVTDPPPRIVQEKRETE
jgi:cell division protein FtsL